MTWLKCHAKEIPVGSLWRERPPYQDRVIEVVGHDINAQKVLIRTLGITRVTRAKPSRFGKDYRREPDRLSDYR